MRFFSSYRNRTIMKKVLIVVLTVLLIALVLCIGALLYLDRYIVYERDGAHLRFKEEAAEETVTAKPDVDAAVSFVSEDDEDAIGSSRRITGCYITGEMLRDTEAVREALEEKDVYAVLIDMKDGYGNFHYLSSITGANTAASINAGAVESLISDLRRSGVYLIARIPAFTDQRACLSNTTLGLPLVSGALWADEQNCYWMDPGNTDVLLYLQNICMELQDLGFREVVLDNFHFPETDSIVYDETAQSKEDVLISAAETLMADMETLDIRVSFGYPADTAFPILLPSERLYFPLEDGAQVASVADTQKAAVVTPTTQIVFLSESRDTRFDDYGHLSPVIESAIPDE